MNQEMFIVPNRGRWWLYKSDKSIVGSKYGYKSREAASRARWFLMQGKEAIKATYKNKGEMSNEMRHWKNI